MRRILMLAAAVALLAGAGAAWSSQGNADPLDYVAGGGTFGPGCFDGSTGQCFGRRRDFSVDVHGGPAGQNPTGRSYYGRNEADAGTTSTAQTVLCLRVDGNRAVVGGTQLVQTATGLEVWGWAREVEDNGPPGPGPRDRSGPTLSDVLDSPDWPEGFPETCPDFDSPGFDVGMLPLHSGDVIVHDGSG